MTARSKRDLTIEHSAQYAYGSAGATTGEQDGKDGEVACYFF